MTIAAEDKTKHYVMELREVKGGKLIASHVIRSYVATDDPDRFRYDDYSFAMRARELHRDLIHAEGQWEAYREARARAKLEEAIG